VYHFSSLFIGIMAMQSLNRKHDVFTPISLFSLHAIYMCILLLLIACNLISTSHAGNCTSIKTESIERYGILFNITGPLIAIHPHLNGSILDELYLKWHLDVFVERSKISQSLSGDPRNFTHVSPTPPFNPYLIVETDPLEPHRTGVACTGRAFECGPLINHFSSADLNCWTERKIVPFHGHTRETVYVHFSHPSHPDFQLTAEHHVLDADFSLAMNNTGVITVQEYRYVFHFPYLCSTHDLDFKKNI
jgi:hypothetical protein